MVFDGAQSNGGGIGTKSWVRNFKCKIIRWGNIFHNVERDQSSTVKGKELGIGS